MKRYIRSSSYNDFMDARMLIVTGLVFSISNSDYSVIKDLTKLSGSEDCIERILENIDSDYVYFLSYSSSYLNIHTGQNLPWKELHHQELLGEVEQCYPDITKVADVVYFAVMRNSASSKDATDLYTNKPISDQLEHYLKVRFRVSEK